jgi:hypothetical protein
VPFLACRARDFCDLARPDGVQECDTSRYERQKFLQGDRFRLKNDDGDFPANQILLVLQPAVYRQQNIEVGRFGGVQKFAVLQATETGVFGRLTLMPGKVVSQSLIYAFVQQNPHSGLGR